jgi:hypothetical protein
VFAKWYCTAGCSAAKESTSWSDIEFDVVRSASHHGFPFRFG